MKLSEVDHHVPLTHCPFCGKELDGASGTNGDQAPRPGDFSVCIGCASPLVFGPDLSLQIISAKHWAALSEENLADLRLMMRAVREIDRRNP